MKAKLVSQSEYARRVSVSHQYISKLVKEGRIKLVGGKVDIEQADKALGIGHGGEADAVDTPDYWHERARHERAKAAIAEIELAAKRGELVAIDDVCVEVEKMLTSFRRKILAIPSKTAHLVFGLKSLGEVRKILDDEIYEALAELANPAARRRTKGNDEQPEV